MTHEDKMLNATWTSPKKEKSLICAMSWNKVSSKKCVIKS
jgi:hypothetical protein